MTEIVIYSRFKRPASAGFSFEQPSMTKQAFKDECNLSGIVDRFITKGQLTSNIRDFAGAMFGEFEEFDFQEAENAIIKAKDMFDAMPSKIRNRFNNDYKELVLFLDDKDNLDEAIALGLVDALPAKQKNELPERPKATEEKTLHNSDGGGE